jgi:hypothetical protein
MLLTVHNRYWKSQKWKKLNRQAEFIVARVLRKDLTKIRCCPLYYLPVVKLVYRENTFNGGSYLLFTVCLRGFEFQQYTSLRYYIHYERCHSQIWLPQLGPHDWISVNRTPLGLSRAPACPQATAHQGLHNPLLQCVSARSYFRYKQRNGTLVAPRCATHLPYS